MAVQRAPEKVSLQWSHRLVCLVSARLALRRWLLVLLLLVSRLPGQLPSVALLPIAVIRGVRQVPFLLLLFPSRQTADRTAQC